MGHLSLLCVTALAGLAAVGASRGHSLNTGHQVLPAPDPEIAWQEQYNPLTTGCLCVVEFVNPPDMVEPWGVVDIDDLFEVLACWGEDVPPEDQHANVIDLFPCNETWCENVNNVNIDDLFYVLWFWGEYPR